MDLRWTLRPALPLLAAALQACGSDYVVGGRSAAGLGSVVHVFGGNEEAGTQNLTFRLP